MLVSSSLRYSLSASSTPARKAPSAMDRPTCTISMAMPTTSSSEVAVKISGVRLRAIQRSRGRSSRRPPTTTAAMVPTVLSTCSHRWLSVCVALAALTAPRMGISARMGMAATSWNSRMEKPAWPLGVRMRLRSAMTCRQMAVDDRARPMPAIRLTRQEKPKAQAARNSTPVQASICASPHPRMGRRSSHRRLGCSSSPITKSISTTPNSAK